MSVGRKQSPPLIVNKENIDPKPPKMQDTWGVFFPFSNFIVFNAVVSSSCHQCLHHELSSAVSFPTGLTGTAAAVAVAVV